MKRLTLKTEYEIPSFELIEVDNADIVCLSNGGEGDGIDVNLP